ncbi:MAG TPA: c-type cytochrome biogenesis protein CcmI [Gammaproteobacteria bacterium]|nr:c-type cytochrome biogenesis protein CcmI [Gammaproteobacteria bacterium]
MPILLWLIASVLAMAALGFVVPALLRNSKDRAVEQSQVNITIAREREQELRTELEAGALSDAEFDAARADLEQGLAIDIAGGPDRIDHDTTSPALAVTVSALLPVAALGLYLFLGSPAAVNNPHSNASTENTGQAQQRDVDTMLAQLKVRLADEPADVQGWTLLANALMSTGQYTEAVPAYRRLVELQPGNAERLVRLADAIAMTNNGVLAGEPEELVRRALTLSPMHPQGLWLAGIAAEQRGVYTEALEIFNRLLPLVSDQPGVLTEVRALVARVTAALEGKPPTQIDALRILISVDPTLVSAITSDDTLFVYARVPNGPPMPVAVRKLQAEPLPREVILSDQDLMLPGAGLGSHAELQIGAHISRSGTVQKAPGDLLGSSEPFNPGRASQINVVIAQVIKG